MVVRIIITSIHSFNHHPSEKMGNLRLHPFTREVGKLKGVVVTVVGETTTISLESREMLKHESHNLRQIGTRKPSPLSSLKERRFAYAFSHRPIYIALLDQAYGDHTRVCPKRTSFSPPLDLINIRHPD